MSYRIAQLAETAQVSVSTIRYYQRRKLLDPPRRNGQVTLYSQAHLERLKQIRQLTNSGYTLAQIKQFIDGEGSTPVSESSATNPPDPAINRAELARRTKIPEFIIDIVVGAGLITPSGQGAQQRFGTEAVAMLTAAHTLVSAGVSFEELTALAMRHATHIENVVDDSIALFKRQAERQGDDRDELVNLLARLVPVVSGLVARHFEQTLVSRALARLGDATTHGGTIVIAKRLAQRLDPLAVYATSKQDQRMLWLRGDANFALVGLGAVETLTPQGESRFVAASAARVAIAARCLRVGENNAPAPMMLGGFSFSSAERKANPDWSGFPDARWVLPEFTIVDRDDGTWVLAAAKVEDGQDRNVACAAIDRRLSSFLKVLPEPIERPFTVTAGPALAEDQKYLALVDEAIKAIVAKKLQKVVLARTHQSTAVDPIDVLHRLRDRYQRCAIYAVAVGDRQFFGASPEQLVALAGPEVRTEAVAGTAQINVSQDNEEAFNAKMLASEKMRAEHQFVVDDIIGRLSQIGLQGECGAEPEVLHLARVAHLRTPITAQISRRVGEVSDMDVLRVAGKLHPTPAVAGTPTEEALDWILQYEDFDRGWYAGPLGWCDFDGNGELCVALRSALVCGDEAVLFAGAGVVAESNPNDELSETAAKLRALLDLMESVDGH